MERFVKGDVVVVPFPFSDLSRFKKRPALVAASLKGDDLILCQITSQSVSDQYSIKLKLSDIENGSLKRISNIRPNRIFTCDQNIILYKVGTLQNKKVKTVINAIIEIFKA